MAQAQRGDTVRVHYTGRVQGGAEFDSSRGRDPMEFTIGSGQVAPGFEKAVIGMRPGEAKHIRVAAKDAYGPYIEGLVQEVEPRRLPASVRPGQKLEIYRPDGSALVVTVKAVSEAKVVLDGNHALAGQDLEFDIELIEIDGR